MRRRMMPIVGDGSGITSFVHLEDAASAAAGSLCARDARDPGRGGPAGAGAVAAGGGRRCSTPRSRARWRGSRPGCPPARRSISSAA
jgi:hypothetical protein